MDEQLSELEKLQQAAQLIEEMSQGRLQVCPSVVGQVYIRPQHDSNLGMDMRIDSIPGQPHYRITFTVQLRRMGTDMLNFVTPRFSPQEMSAMFKPSWHIGTKYVSGLLSGLWRRKRTFLQNAGGYLNRMNTRLRTVCLCTLSSVG